VRPFPSCTSLTVIVIYAVIALAKSWQSDFWLSDQVILKARRLLLNLFRERPSDFVRCGGCEVSNLDALELLSHLGEPTGRKSGNPPLSRLMLHQQWGGVLYLPATDADAPRAPTSSLPVQFVAEGHPSSGPGRALSQSEKGNAGLRASF